MRNTTSILISELREPKQVAYDTLMLRRVRNVLLVSSLYDSFTFEEDGRLTELLFSEYLELNLRYAPNIVRVSTAEAALQELSNGSFDLVISMLHIGDMDVAEFGWEVSRLDPGLPVVLLTHNTRELDLLNSLGRLPGIDRVFVWLGDVRLFLAIIKYVEDRMNALNDSQTAGVQSIILIEDNVRFYSAYLPLAYTELVRQTQKLMADGINRMDKMLRMRARPKILLATSYEEGERIYLQHKAHVAGVILDARFPRNGKMDTHAGLEFAQMVKKISPDRPILIQSSDQKYESIAHSLGLSFVNKRSPNLLGIVSNFMRDHMGFGDFVFRLPNGKEVGKAADLRSLMEMLEKIPAESLAYHVSRNDISTWLMARTEFDLAKILRPRQIDEFENVEEVRKYLIDQVAQYRDRSRAGVVADFSDVTFEGKSGFARIGTGSLGGKGRGLAFMYALIEKYKMTRRDDDINIYVPATVVLATGVFEEFMQQPGLKEIAFDDSEDQAIAEAMTRAELPLEAMVQLRTFLSRVCYPLAVRSSSLLEDASYQPFAGLYSTYMIPNNHEDIEMRLEQLTRAIKLVYASTYFRDAKEYIKSTPNRLEEEKMAVVIQQVVGRHRGDYLYPDIAGVVRSYDYYPMEGTDPESGVASVVLGLGKAVVDGGPSVRFSPAQPRRLYQFYSPEETLKNAQSQFLALDLTKSEALVNFNEQDAGIAALSLDVAEKDGILPAVGSVYSPENDAIYDGTSRKGPRLVTMAGVLKAEVFPLARTLQKLIELGTGGMSNQVEIEFAANIRRNLDEPHEFGFLQIRPAIICGHTQDINLSALEWNDTICISNKALGNGFSDDICDIVHVPKSLFKRSETIEIASEIGHITAKLRAADRPFLIIGPGRWGSADRWLGIPVSWSQIAGVRCIVETDMDDIRVQPSQGTHFFQNITSFGICYFTVNFDNVGGRLDEEWLEQQPAEIQSNHVRLLHFEKPTEVIVSGKKGIGAIMKPGLSFLNNENCE